MKFLNKVDERDVDERAQPGGDVRYYLTDLKNRTSMQMGLSGESSLPRSREALELRAILRGLQNDSWPMKYKQEGADFRQPSALAYQFSRPPSHLHHPPRNQYQRILSSQKLEDSVVSLKSYLGRTLDTLEEGHVPILTRRRGRFKNGSDVDSAKRSKYSRERTDDDLRKKMRPHTNTPTQVGGTVVNISKEEDNKSMVEDEHGLDAKSSARDDGYYSISHISQSDNCSFILGPRNWTPVNSQAPVDEIVQPKTPTIDIKKMVDKGSTHLGDESSLDDGLDGEGIVVGLAQGSDDSDVEIIYSHTDVPDNTLEAMEISDSYKTSFKANSIKSVSSDIFKNEDSLVEGDNSIASSKIQSAIVSQRTVSRSKSRNFSVDNLSNEDKDLNLDSSYSKSLLKFETDNIGNNVVATSCDDENYNTDPEFIASDGEDIDDLIENENEITLVSNEKDSVSHSEINERAKSRTLSSASSHKRSRTPSSMHSFAQDDDQSSVTILPHDQELISVDVRSSKSRQSDKSQNNAHDMEQVAPVIGQIAQEGDFTIKVKDTESVLTGDDATSVVMSMGEDTSTVMDVLRDLHGDDEERDKLGEIIDPRFPRDDRGRIDMIEIPHPSTPRSTEIATEDKVSPRVKSESSSKLGEKVEETMDPETMVSVQGDTKLVKTKTEYPVIPDFLKPKPPPKGQQKKDLKKKGQLQKGGKKGGKTGSKDVTKAIDITSVQPEEPVDEITQIIRKKVTLPPEKEHSVIPDFVSEAIKRSAERSKLQLEKEYREQQELISKEIGDTLFEGQEGMTAEELELAKKALKEKEEMTKEKLLKGKQQKKVDEKSRKSGGSSSIKSKKSKGAGGKDPLQLEKERIRELKELEKQQRLEEIKALEARIQAANEGLSAEEKKFKDKLLEVQLELDRIEREAHMADQTEADVRQALKEDRMKRMEDKARQKKEELARKRQMQLEKKQQERQLKEEARQRELQKIMMLMDDEERRRRQEEEKQRQLKEEEEEEKRRKEEEEEMARLDREEEERRRQLEEEIEQEQLKRLQEEQDELRRQQEAVAAQKQALLEEQRRQRELAALEEQRYMEELERRKREEMKKIAEDKARMQELQKLEEDVRESMRRDMELRKENAIKRREYNIEAKSNLNKIKHSQGITRAWVWSYFIQWPMDTYMRPVGEQEKKKKEAKLREKRKKAR